MGKIDDYRTVLRTLEDWDDYLTAHSNLPGPRADLELAYATALEGDEARWAHWRAISRDAPTNTPGEFIAFCGVIGLGAPLKEGRRDALATLRPYASDPRWRVREAVAMALQAWGSADMPALLAEMDQWAHGNRLEQRAAVAGLADPGLLRDPDAARRVLAIFDAITQTLVGAADAGSEDNRVLRQALGYAWSVAAVALPDEGKRCMERWLVLRDDDPDVRWVMRENLKKNRLIKMDPAWVAEWSGRLKR